MQGLTWASLKKNPSLFPLFFCFGVGGLMAVGYTLRLATRNPDVSWSKKKNLEPWQEYSDKYYKFWHSDALPDKPQSQAPKY